MVLTTATKSKTKRGSTIQTNIKNAGIPVSSAIPTPEYWRFNVNVTLATKKLKINFKSSYVRKVFPIRLILKEYKDLLLYPTRLQKYFFAIKLTARLIWVLHYIPKQSWTLVTVSCFFKFELLLPYSLGYHATVIKPQKPLFWNNDKFNRIYAKGKHLFKTNNKGNGIMSTNFVLVHELLTWNSRFPPPLLPAKQCSKSTINF